VTRSPLPCRRSIRLRGYDYSRSGAYFVTLVTQDRCPLFGRIRDDVMVPNEAGREVQEVWDAIPHHYAGIDLDEFVVMPDHVHGIVLLLPRPERRLTLPDVVHRFKTMTTRRYVDGVRTSGWPGFPIRLWHRNYYERVVRDEIAFQRIRAYIVANPSRWRKRRLPRTQTDSHGTDT
jgi:REP element-mobilizing transposase RayT